MKFTFLVLFLAIFLLGCPRHPVEDLSKGGTPYVELPGCPGVIGLRAKTAKIVDSFKRDGNVAISLQAALNTDVKATDSILKSGGKGTVSSALNTKFTQYFAVDQSFDNDVWNQQAKFDKLKCLAKNIIDDPRTSAESRNQWNSLLLQMVKDEHDYEENLKKKDQN